MTAIKTTKLSEYLSQLRDYFPEKLRLYLSSVKERKKTSMPQKTSECFCCGPVVKRPLAVAFPLLAFYHGFSLLQAKLARLGI